MIYLIEFFTKEAFAKAKAAVIKYEGKMVARQDSLSNIPKEFL